MISLYDIIISVTTTSADGYYFSGRREEPTKVEHFFAAQILRGSSRTGQLAMDLALLLSNGWEIKWVNSDGGDLIYTLIRDESKYRD